MEISMHMRRMGDGYMHRRMQENKHVHGDDLDTPTSTLVQHSMLTLLWIIVAGWLVGWLIGWLVG